MLFFSCARPARLTVSLNQPTTVETGAQNSQPGETRQHQILHACLLRGGLAYSRDMPPLSVYLEECAEATRHRRCHGKHLPARLRDLLQASGKNINATNEPKHIPLIGAPDFKVSRGKVPLGHVETKDIGTDLAEMEKGKGRTASSSAGTVRAQLDSDGLPRISLVRPR